MRSDVLFRGQRGATLIVTMIFLVLLTFLGVSTIQDTSLEEKMASNLRFKTMVFQQAESVLREAEDELGKANPPTVGSVDWLYDEDYELSLFDSCAVASFAAPSWKMVTTDALQSGYVAQEIPVLGVSDSAETGVAQDEQKLYRITACARSTNTSAVVVLQSTFSR